MALSDSVGRARRAWVAAFALAGGCVPTVEVESRSCPCAAGYVCCAATNACLRDASACGSPAFAVDGGSPPASPSSPDSSVSVPQPDASEASSDASVADSASPGCGAVPKPVVHFTFDDCDDGGVYRDTASNLVGIRQGGGVRCAHGPLGAALQFDGDVDGGGSYVRVMDAADAGEHGCTGACRPVPQQFADALTISAVLRVGAGQPFAHILGQWYYSDSYMLLTESSDAGQRMEFSVQQRAGDSGPTTLEAFFPVETWIHWVAVFDGFELRLYRDGALAMYKPLAQAGGLQCSDVPLELGQIGRKGPCGGDIDYAFFKGSIGDLQLFDVALTAGQVGALECALRTP